MDIKSLTDILQLSMLSKITSDNSTDTQNIDNQSSDLFELLLQEIIQNAGAGVSNNSSEQLLNSNDSSITNNDITGIDGNNDNLNGNNSSQINSAIEQASQKYGVDSSFIKAMIKQESGFHPDAVSKAGAEGLMQLMPKTAESLGIKNPFDVLENIDGGTKYIKNLIDSFGGSKELALSAYNGGISRMNRLGVNNVSKINNMPKETQNYVAKVMKIYEDYKNS